MWQVKWQEKGLLYIIVSAIGLMGFLFIWVLAKAALDSRSRRIRNAEIELMIRQKTGERIKRELTDLQNAGITGPVVKDYDKQEVKVEVGYNKKITHVPCCCTLLKISISKFYFIQNMCSSFSFWVIFGVSLIADFDYAVYPCVIWSILATCVTFML